MNASGPTIAQGGDGRIAFYFPHLTGHNLEYLQHIDAVFGSRDRAPAHIIITQAVNKALIDRLPAPLELQVHYVGPRADGYSSQTNSTGQAIRQTWKNFQTLRSINALCKNMDIETCVLMHLNIFQLALPFIRAGAVKYRGILFFPYIRLELEKQPGARRRLILWAKRCALSFMCRQSRLDSVFILNDRKAAEMLNERHAKCRSGESNVFKELPDPVPDLHGGQETQPDRDAGRRTMSLLGAIDDRKGAFQLLEAIKHIPTVDQKCLRIAIIGRFHPQHANALLKKISEQSLAFPDVEFITEDRFLDSEEFVSLVRKSHVLLLPYQRAEGSSGMLGHAAAHATPVIGPKNGLVGALIRDYGLGITIDATDPSALAHAITTAIKDPVKLGFSCAGSKKYVEERQPEAFVLRLTAA